MDGIRRHLPSPATLISVLALVVALSGSAYAASVAKNSVGSGQVKNGSLKGADIKDNKLTGADIDEKTLVGVNAGEVGGLPAVSLGGRIASAYNAGDNALTADPHTDVASTTFTVPVRSVVKVEVTGWFIASAASDCPCVVWAYGRLSNEAPSGFNDRLLAVGNLTDFVDGYARVPYHGARTIVLGPGKYTFFHTIRKAYGATATKTTMGSASSRLIVTSYPLDGAGVVPLKPTPEKPVRLPSGKV